MKLEAIRKTKGQTRPPRILLYGEQKVGKSTLAAQAKAPVFIPTEEGLDAIDAHAFPRPTRFSEVLEAIQSIASGGHDYSTVVIDSLTMLEPLIWDATCARMGYANIEDPGYGTGYGQALNEWRELTRALDRLQAGGYGCILIGHSVRRKVDEPGMPSYQQAQIDINAKACAFLASWADLTGYMAVQAFAQKEDQGFGKSRNFAVSTGQRVLHVDKSPSHVAGNRYGLRGAIEMPEGQAYSALRQAILKATQGNTKQAKEKDQ